MQHSKQKIGFSFTLIVIAILIGGIMMATRTSQAAPVAQDSGDDGALDNPIFIPFVAGGADTTAAGTPLTPDQYDAQSEEAPALSDDQIQASTWCAAYIKFGNSSSHSIKVYYVNSWGQESLYYTLGSGSYYWQFTYYGNSWKVRDTSGNLLKSFTANSCYNMYVSIDNSDFPQPTATPTSTPTSSSGGACYTEIIATHSNKCMDVTGASSGNNAQIQQYSCSGGDNQKFLFSPVPGKTDTYVIRVKHSGKAVDVLYGSTSGGKDLVQYSANGSSSQQWKIVSVGGNIFELKNINSGLVADVEGNSSSNGAHVIQWSDGNAPNQRWQIDSCLGQQPTPTNTPQPTPTNTAVPATPTNTPAPQLGSIGDRVWNDVNRNGIQDAGEPGVSGVTVQLKNCSGGVLQSTTTNGSGIYTFSNLSAGCYMVGIVVPGGYQISPKAQGTDGNLDSDINIGNAMSDNINLGAGQNITNIDAGINQPVAPTPTNTPAPQLGSIGDRVWNDANNNGIQDGGELGISGISVQLRTCGGTTVQNTTTDGNGLYRFNGLSAGCYVVRFVNINSNTYAFSPGKQGGNDNLDSDVTSLDSVTPGIINGQTDQINLGAGQNLDTIDAGLNQPVGPTPTPTNTPAPQLGSIGDKVFRDDNGNGQQDGGEPGVSGVTVQLKNCSGSVLQTTTTDGNGIYGFSGLAAGCYTIGVVLPGGYTFSPVNVGNDNTDSDINPGTAMSDNVNLAAGQTNNTVDAGLVPQAQNNASIGDKVFRDDNGNGQQDGGEPGVSGVTVQLKNCSGSVLQTTTTDGNGNYGFSGLAAGCYTIGVVLPGGYTFSPVNIGNDNTDSDINPGTAMSDNVNLAAGETNNTVDAGLVPQGSGGDTCIGDRVWYDTNMNGIQDAGEMGINGAEVYLGIDNNDDGHIDRYVGNMTTVNGAYLFCGLDPAPKYAVEFVPPMGCGITLPNQGTDDTKDSDADLSKGTVFNVMVNAGQTNDTVDAGFVCGAD